MTATKTRPAAELSAGRRWLAPVRRGLAVAVLASVGTGCSLLFTSAPPPDPNTFFVGCFRGAPALGGEVTLVLRSVTVSEPGQDDRFSVAGCFQSQVEDLMETAVVGGATTGEDPFVVTLSGVFPSGTPVDLTVTRQPESDEPAQSVAIASSEEKLDGVATTVACGQTFEQLCPSQLVPR